MVLLLLGVIGALASAGVLMLRKREGHDPRMARALAVRIGLSIALFALILFSWFMGWVRPSGIPTGY